MFTSRPGIIFARAGVATRAKSVATSRSISAREPKPCGTDRLADHHPTIGTVFDRQALDADGPNVDRRARHATEELDVELRLAEKDGVQFWASAPRDPIRAAHPSPVEAVLSDLVAIGQGGDMEHFGLGHT